MACGGVRSPRVLLFLLVVVAAAPCIHAALSIEDPVCTERAKWCCRFPMFSYEFFACCEEVGCCPIDCFQMPISITVTNPTPTAITVTQGNNYYTPYVTEPTPECVLGLICCRFPLDSLLFALCSEEHRCHPNCDQVSGGCCYNGRVWAWGSVVEEFEAACVNLVCAAQQTDEPPFLAARLVLVDRPGGGCYDSANESWLGSVCVDVTGMVREVGELFSLDECHHCQCLAGGGVQCRNEKVECPQLPARRPASCHVVEGPCCPWLNCSVERNCLDINNQVHALYATWRSDPCTSHQCTLAGIITTRQQCPLPPHPNCVLAGELELELELELDLDLELDLEVEEENGSLEESDEDECCPKWKCGLDCRVVRCSLVPPGEDCIELYEPLACCPKWNCSGCVDDANNYHAMGSSWHPTLCTILTCTPLGIVNTTAPCKPKPHEVCSEDTTKTGCCPVYDCGGCEDKYRKFRPMFSKWEVGRCTFMKCTPRGIVAVKPECPPKPHSNCFEGALDEECCPQWECGPDCRLVRCAGPPQPGCTPYVPPLACCPQWNCSVCVDEAGQRREAGSIWRTDDPCINKTCTETGEVVSVAVTCALSKPPRQGCFQYTPDGECCPTWNCSGCLDDHGVFYSLFEAWNTDPCTSHFCNPSGIYTQVIRCPTLGPMLHPNCVVQVPPGQCCSEWVCGDDCRLILCPRPPEGDCTSHRPPQACCDEWTCNGCTDETGKQHKIGEPWLEKHCLLRRCTKQGIITTNLCDRYSPSGLELRRKRGSGVMDGKEVGAALGATDPHVDE